MTSHPTSSVQSPDETRLKSLIRAVLREDGLLHPNDSEQTIENSLMPGTPSPSDEPFTSHWYASLTPHRVRDPFKAPDTHPSFFHVRDAQHAALFNPTTAAGGCPEADVLYQTIAFLQRSLDDLLSCIEGPEISAVWRSVKGVVEMLHTRYDLLCALRRSRDDEHIRYLETYLQPPSGDGAASAKAHRDICRAASKKRPREEAKEAEEPPQARAKTLPSATPEEDEEVEIVETTAAEPVSKRKATNAKSAQVVKTEARPTATKKSSPSISRSKSVAVSSKAKPAITPKKSSSSPIVSRTRSADASVKRRSSSTPARSKSGASASKTEKPVTKQVASSKEATPNKKLTLSKRTTPIKKVVSEKKATPSKRATPNKTAILTKRSTPSKSTPSKSAPSKSGTAIKQAVQKKKPSPIKEVTPSKRVTSAKRAGPNKPPTQKKDLASTKKTTPQNPVVPRHEAVDKVEGKTDEVTILDEKTSPNPQVNGAKGAKFRNIEQVEIGEPEQDSKKVSVHQARLSVGSAALLKKPGSSAEPSSKPVMTNFTFVIRGYDSGEAPMRSPLHSYAGFQWRIVVYPRGDKHTDWMSVYLECRGPVPSSSGVFEQKKQLSGAKTETGDAKTDRAWLARVKFSVRVLRTDSTVTKAALAGKETDVNNDHGLLSASKVSSDGKIAQAGLLSDFVGAIPHDFSPLSDRAGFSRLAPISCLSPGMYADTDKNVALIVFMCVEQ